ncbi:MAG: SDR family oxidoreductase [Bacteroidota bacterium]
MQGRWNLNGRKAMVTGASKGIGREIAKEFIELGAYVIAVARNAEELESISSEVSAPDRLYIHSSDIRNKIDRESLFELINIEFNSLDILINNAGTNIRKRTEDYDNEELEFLLDTNLKAHFELTREAVKYLEHSDFPSIVNISSSAAVRIVKTGVPYAMSKAALSHMTRYLACEWGPKGIRVNAIEPWYIQTPLTEPVLNNEKAYNKIIERTPMKRIGSVDEISGLAAFLCMMPASYINGECITVDGGALKFLF